MSDAAPARRGPPPLKPFGLVLHHDGRWTHEGFPILNAKLRAAFDRGVRYLPDEGKYVVQLAHFRGEIELEEAGFFVRDYEAVDGSVALSDGSREPLDVASLHASPRDGALLCRVKHALCDGGLLARFTHAAQAELLAHVEEGASGTRLRCGDRLEALPDL